MNPKIKAPDYPLVTFTGKVHYLYNYWDIAEAFENLTMKVEATEGKDQVPVAFDMEWPYDKKTDISGKTALIQVCMNLDECFLFHLPLLRKLPATMCIFLKHPRVLLHGVNIKGDMNKLQNDFPVFNAELMLKKCVDLRDWYNEVSGFNCTMRWSLQSLGKHALGLCVNKSLRASSWNVIPLTEAQQQYAAIDVFVSNHHAMIFSEKSKLFIYCFCLSL